jgi:PAS domain S-box-containing protein
MTLDSRTILHVILDSLDDDVTLVDLRGRVLATGTASARRLGVENPQEAIGMDAFSAHAHALAEGRRAALSRVANCGIAEVIEDQEDGQWWSVRLAPVAGPWHTIEAVLIRAREISETRNLALALRDSEERFRGTFDAAGHGMALVELDGRFRMVNPVLRDLLGLSEETPGDLPSTVFPGDIKIALDLIRRLGNGQETSVTVRMRFVGADGNTIWALVSATLQSPRVGEQPYVVMHLRDVTQEHLAEHRLRDAKEEADRASRAKTRFLAAASHDLRQPLQALNMFVSVLAAREDDPRKREIVTKIEKTAEALTGLLNTLLDISKLDAGLMRREPRDISLTPLLSRLADEFHPVAAAKGLGFGHVSSAARAHADPALVEIILRNFLGNAVRYTPKGRILLGVRHRSGGMVEIQVVDTGSGVPEEQHSLIFEDFHQVENPAREKGEGLGLGLAIVKRVAALLDARITLASTPGKGSRFGLVLPPPQGVLAGYGTGGLRSAEPEAAQGLTVLLIDDEPAILDGLTLVLEGWECEVLAFDDLEGLREGLESGGFEAPPDVIIADYRLGERETGVDAVTLIRTHFAQPVPALLLTGDTAPQRLREADASGLPLLHKPVKPEVLRGAIADLLAGGLTLEDTTQESTASGVRLLL